MEREGVGKSGFGDIEGRVVRQGQVGGILVKVLRLFCQVSFGLGEGVLGCFSLQSAFEFVLFFLF